MRIPGRPKREGPFARKRAPPPQATKLLTTSMAAGIILIVLLAAVFIPRALYYEGLPRPPTIGLEFEAGAGFRVVAANVSEDRPLSEWAATLWILPDRNETISPLAHLAASGPLRYEDTDGSGTLSTGDAFPIAVQPSLTYRFYLEFLPLNRVVVVTSWTGGTP